MIDITKIKDYYDGHYIDSGLSPKERQKRVEDLEKSDEGLTEWIYPTE